MSPACKMPENQNPFRLAHSSAAPALVPEGTPASDAPTSEVPVVNDAPATEVPVALQVVNTDGAPAEVSDERAGGIQQESPYRSYWIALAGGGATVLLIALGQMVSDLVRATPVYKKLHVWFGEMDFSFVIDFLRGVGRFLANLIPAIT